MRYRYLDDFRRGISVFAIFSYGIAVLDTPPMSPSFVSPRAWKQKKPTPLYRGPPLHVNRP